ncbi:hypothetical protein ACFL1M_02520 [Patescibacteria group bacterium]
MPPAPIKSTTQDHLDILDITNDIIMQKDGSCSLVLKVSAVNFDLLSEQEQEAIIFAYAGLLNSLTFPIQILVKSQRKDVSKYLDLLQEQENVASTEKKRRQIFEYRKFIGQIVKEGNVLDKKFYCVIPFSRLELGLGASNPLSLKKERSLPYDKDYILKKALATLNPKKDHIVRQFARVGLNTKQLNTNEIVHLFYTAYNPNVAKETGFSKIDRLDSPITQSTVTLSPPVQESSPEQKADPSTKNDQTPNQQPQLKTEIVQNQTQNTSPTNKKQ